MNAQEWDDLVTDVHDAVDHYDHPGVDWGDVNDVLAAYFKVTGVDLATAPPPGRVQRHDAAARDGPQSH